MGLPMCANLAAAGYEVIAADARPGREQAVTECGAHWAATPAGAASRAGILITMLPGPAAVSDVMTGTGGALAALPPEATWIDMTSNSPAAGRALAAAARARGIAVLDAPAGGGRPPPGRGRCSCSSAARPPCLSTAARCWRCSPTRAASSTPAATGPAT
jgi:3-hydroxyisobutyrate dehydrogenase